MNKKEFIEELKKINIEITEEALAKLEIYQKFLQEYNQHTNLTSITSSEEIYLKHFYDSLTFTKVINPKEYKNLIDVGTGAGFPGMVLKILFPNLHVTLLDSNNKKILFLQELAQKLNLDNISICHERVEDFIKKNREKYDLVTARAVTNMTNLCELCLPLTKKNGYFIAMKGSNKEEIKQAKYAINILGGILEKEEKFHLPIENSERTILKIKKVKDTPKEYPRRYDKIIKYPLKNKDK